MKIKKIFNKEIIKKSIFLFLFQSIFCTIAGFILGFLDGVIKHFVDDHISIQFAALPITFIMMALCNFLYIRYLHKKNLPMLTNSSIKLVSLGVATFQVITATIFIVNFTLFSAYIRNNLLNTLLLEITYYFLALSAVMIFINWLNRSSLSFANYLVNKQSISLGKFTLISAVSVITLFLGIVYMYTFYRHSKTAWIINFKDNFNHIACNLLEDNSNLKQLLDSKHITHTKCLTLMKECANKCIDEISKEIPDKINIWSGKEYGGKIGECAGNEFYNQNIK